jgi:hypothetical protein
MYDFLDTFKKLFRQCVKAELPALCIGKTDKDNRPYCKMFLCYNIRTLYFVPVGGSVIL